MLTIRDLEVQLRDFIAAKFGEILATQGLSVMDVSANLSAVNARLAPAVAPYFEDLGVSVTQFTIALVTLPDEVNEYIEHARDTEVSTETKVCPGCGAGRSEAHGVAECRYCGYVFIAPLAGPTARREP
ncbi:MAG: SPFH domain-containing protein [Actinomyces sp.]|uniref:SPFH domain-containing protein n=1 Tax=Actinomyces sp. TaxID=29317 RepID=UPI0026DC7DD8|nr:SPFH domain-containing protein [Actinomyces sp.]MDO4242870.1 SPFH domain-containing protein [Actinomyces sp.]